MTQDPITSDNQTPCLGKGNGKGCSTLAVQQDLDVRRLTPTECERLQGFPDGWTEPLGSDTKRYAAMGDAVTVNVGEWLAQRCIDHYIGR